MRVSRWVVAGALSVVGCATAASTNVRPPLGAMLTPTAKTGGSVRLHYDPTARVILSNASSLPPASYLPSQATRGASIYAETCGTCHQPGQLVGQNFAELWNDRRVYDFYSLIRSTMPLDNPGGMKDQEYIDVVAYLLQANHQAATKADSLKADTVALRATKIAVHP